MMVPCHGLFTMTPRPVKELNSGTFLLQQGRKIASNLFSVSGFPGHRTVFWLAAAEFRIHGLTRHKLLRTLASHEF